MENGKVFEQIAFVNWMHEKHPIMKMNEWQLLFIGIYFQNRIRGEYFLKNAPDAIERDSILKLLSEFMQVMGIQKDLTTRERFAEQLSSLKKRNQSHHCSTCDDSFVRGFQMKPDGTEDLLVCSCATFGETEYTRLFDAMIELEKNLSNLVLSARDRNERWFTITNQAMMKNFQSMVENFVTMGDGFDKTIRHTFYGGLKYGILRFLQETQKIFSRKEIQDPEKKPEINSNIPTKEDLQELKEFVQTSKYK